MKHVRIDMKVENNEMESAHFEIGRILNLQTSGDFLSYTKSVLKDFMDFAFWPAFTVWAEVKQHLAEVSPDPLKGNFGPGILGSIFSPALNYYSQNFCQNDKLNPTP